MRYWILLLFATMALSLSAANLIHEFTFDGNLSDAIGNSTLEPINVNSSYFDGGAWHWSATSNPGAGLLLPAYLSNNECYTLQIHFKYSSFNYAWTKILNFSDIQQIPWGYFSNDTGLYFNGVYMSFYNAMFDYDNNYYSNTWYDLIITRGTDTLVSVFIAELGQVPQLVMQFQDYTGIAIPSSLDNGPESPSYFGLFYDDIHNGTEWTTGGIVSLVKVWDDTINPFVINDIAIEVIDGSTHLSWSQVQGATLYHVYYSDVPNPDVWNHLGVSAEPSFIHPTSDPKKFYQVTAQLP